MRVLRDNKESLMAVLEAFVYDPLINWRLMPTETDKRIGGTHAKNNCSDNSCQSPVVNDSVRAAELARVTAYPQGPTRKLKADENDILNGESSIQLPPIAVTHV